MVTGQLERGCSMVGQSYLITVTFRTDGVTLRSADSVKVVWTRFLRSFKSRYPNLKWARVIEATKRGQPHIHAIMAGMPGSTADCKKGVKTKKHLLGICAQSHECLTHFVAKNWYDATGDSYIIDVKPVLGARGAARYLTKYLGKAMMYRQSLWDRGFKRFWSTSRNWPRLDKMQLRRTLDDEWKGIEFQYAGIAGHEAFRDAAQADIDSPLAARVGSPLAQFYQGKQDRHRHKSAIKEYLDAFNRSPTEPTVSGGGQ